MGGALPIPLRDLKSAKTPLFLFIILDAPTINPLRTAVEGKSKGMGGFSESWWVDLGPGK